MSAPASPAPSALQSANAAASQAIQDMLSISQQGMAASLSGGEGGMSGGEGGGS
ncbi:MAG TPA: hypothetical protein PK867_29245 [Pirellulales bacterium]|nr:hypothetical protein [Pirellulales bacterium]